MKGQNCPLLFTMQWNEWSGKKTLDERSNGPLLVSRQMEQMEWLKYFEWKVKEIVTYCYPRNGTNWMAEILSMKGQYSPLLLSKQME